MKFASFDLEISKEVPEGTQDWDSLGMLGITCAGVALSDTKEEIYWHAPGRLSKAQCKGMVQDFLELIDCGYTFLTWNGLHFDFKVLAQESGSRFTCAQIALCAHIDMMLYVTFIKGYYLGLQAALKGAGCTGKLKEVKLKSGEIVTGMEGSQAPALWAAGEYDAVLTYLQSDILQPLELIERIQANREIRWVSNAGKVNSVRVPELLLAHECFKYPLPDTSWMTDPPKREDFVSWMPKACTQYLF